MKFEIIGTLICEDDGRDFEGHSIEITLWSYRVAFTFARRNK